jgi:7-carboxy-7-deazaguanine synthase
MVERIGKIGLRYVCITGGEPLLQEDTIPLVYELILSGYKVSIETSGCVPIEPDPYSRTYKYVMDIKCPCSGVTEKNIYGNLALLKNNDEVKFVIKDRIDYDFFKETLNKYPTAAKVLLSPMFDSEGRQVIGRKLSEWIIEDKLTDVRIQIQQHKILGVE